MGTMKGYLLDRFFRGFENNYPELREQKRLFKEIYRMVEAEETNKYTRQYIKQKLDELSELTLYNLEEKIMKLEPAELKRRAQLVEKFGAEDGYMAIAKTVGGINEQYNHRTTDHLRYLDAQVVLLEYKSKNQREIGGLEDLASTARRFKADVLAEEAEKFRERLLKEEQDLQVMVQRLNPENFSKLPVEAKVRNSYYNVIQYLQKKMRLYRAQGRNELLGAYQKFIREYDDSSLVKRMWIETANRYLCNKNQTLDEHVQNAQVLRRPVPELTGEEAVELAQSRRKKRERLYEHGAR